MDALGRRCLKCQPSSRTGENPPYGMIGGIVETSASFEARYAPRSYPTAGGDQRWSSLPQPFRVRSYRSTFSSSQMPPDSSAMVNTSLSWVSESPTGGINRGIISRELSNFDT